MIQYCKRCQKPFKTAPSEVAKGKGKYCSRECYNKARKNGIWLKCLVCGKAFRRTPSVMATRRATYCSRDCYNETRKRSVRKCATCGKPFEARQDRGKYCSIECVAVGHAGPRNILECIVCHKMFSLPQRRGKPRFCSKACQGKWQTENWTGEGNPFWKGGTSFEPYPLEFNKPFKRLIRKRDMRRCQVCGKAARDVHHIDYNKEHNTPENCITLCRHCHGRTNGDRELWTGALFEHQQCRKEAGYV